VSDKRKRRLPQSEHFVMSRAMKIENRQYCFLSIVALAWHGTFPNEKCHLAIAHSPQVEHATTTDKGPNFQNGANFGCRTYIFCPNGMLLLFIALGI
jgi:hypothetical protein